MRPIRPFHRPAPRPAPLLLAALTALAAGAVPASAQQRPAAQPISVVEATIPQMREALEQKRVTSRELVMQSLARIATYEERVNAVIAVNPRALALADSLDRER